MGKLWRRFKHILLGNLSLGISVADAQITEGERADLVQPAYANTIPSGIFNMSERPDLLISLDKIMLRSFPTVQSSDVLASAFSVFALQDLDEIIVLDDDGNFSGIVVADMLYKKMPCGTLDIPPQLRNSNNGEESMSKAILEIGRRRISDVLTLSKPSRLFQAFEPLSILLSEINSLYNYYLTPKIIPVFDRAQVVQGVILTG